MSSVDISSSVLDLERVRDEARDALFDALASRRGRKALVLDPRLGAPLMRITEMSSLRQHGVDRLYYLEGGTLETTCHEVVFLVRPRLELMHKLAEVVKSVLDEVDAATREHERAYSGKPANDPSVPPRPKVPRFTVFFVSARPCRARNSSTTSASSATSRWTRSQWISFPSSATSSPSSTTTRTATSPSRRQHQSFYVAQAIHELQKVTGEAPIVKGKGAAAKDVAEIFRAAAARGVARRGDRGGADRGSPDPDPEWGRRGGRGRGRRRRGGAKKSGEVGHRLRRASTGTFETRRARASGIAARGHDIALGPRGGPRDAAVHAVDVRGAHRRDHRCEERRGGGARRRGQDRQGAARLQRRAVPGTQRFKLWARVRTRWGSSPARFRGITRASRSPTWRSRRFPKSAVSCGRLRITCRARDSTCTPPSPSTFWTARGRHVFPAQVHAQPGHRTGVRRGSLVGPIFEHVETMIFTGETCAASRGYSRSRPSLTAAFPRNRTTHAARDGARVRPAGVAPAAEHGGGGAAVSTRG